ncbi:hypothetical protein X474_11685 [Dethiosulfatarculus sandiegensis]|uniref:Uncharacterized protein n=1 Tax=Dethiosulfatarculus sandiegensis TaxID=1429043 RepID=A0A0D2HTS9_9BACT|nr:hypothetical protein X474_11685 [Dethiosulfatarculus sandiegensis]
MGRFLIAPKNLRFFGDPGGRAPQKICDFSGTPEEQHP